MKADLKPGTEIRIAVTDLDGEGAGIGTLAVPAPPPAGVAAVPLTVLEVHVPGALPGDEISAHIDHVSTHRPVAWARLGMIHRASPHRVSPTCRAHGRCGGCVLQHFNYVAQVAWKESVLRSLVENDPILRDVPVAPVVPSPLVLGYRNKAKLVAARDDSGELILGAYAPRSHDVVDLAGCAVTEPPLADVAATLREILVAHAVEPYDERRLIGSLRYVVLRVNARGNVLITLVTLTDAFPAGAAIAATLKPLCPNVSGVIQNVNPTRGNAIYGPTERTLGGAPAIEDDIGGVRLRISSRAFFQANRHVAQKAYAALANAVALTGSERVVDAYAGVGGIALTLAPQARSVLGIEEHASAVADALASTSLNGVTNARFVVGDVAQELGTLDSADIVVLNPPRKGCSPVVLQRTTALCPRAIAYLSCAPDTLLRDLNVLVGLGYRASEIAPFDMLPHTPHLEALAILTR